MRKQLPKIRLIGAYASLGLLFAGCALFTVVFIQARTPVEASDDTTGGSLQAQRMTAIEEAKRQGKNEYSFDAGKAPVPVSP